MTPNLPIPSIVLASASPRRQELLRSMNLDFAVVPSDATELHTHDLTATEICQLNAYRKAWAVARKHPDELVLGADTLVYMGTKLYGKPADRAEAQEMLSELQGELHEVVTGVCLIHLKVHRQIIFSEVTRVKFRPLSKRQISDYLALINPLDKAGSYAIQEHGGLIVENIQGSLSNVIGLPVERLQKELDAWVSSGG